MIESSAQEIDKLLQYLKQAPLAYNRRRAVEEIEKLSDSNRDIVRALVIAETTDSDRAVREKAAKALLGAAHVAVIQGNRDLAEWKWKMETEQMMQPCIAREATDDSRRFWRKWMLANCLGWGLSLLLSFFATALVSHSIIAITGNRSPLGALIGGGIMGILQGSIHWLALEQSLHYGTAAKWIGVSGAGWALAILTGFIKGREEYPYYSETVLWTTAILAVMSIGQWMVLKKESRRAIWWVPANTVGTTLVVWAWVVSETYFGETMASMCLSLIPASVIVGTVYGLLTGWVLQKVLQSDERRA